MPYIYVFHDIISKILWWIKSIFVKTNEIRKKEENIALKPKGLEEKK